MLKALLKKQLLEMTAFLRRSSVTGRSRSGWRLAAAGALAAALLLLVMGSVGVLAALLCAPLAAAGLEPLYFALLGAQALAVGVMGGGFAAYGTLYCPRDNELLLALPIPPGLLLAVRMGAVWLWGAGYLAVILVPGYIAYFLLAAQPGPAALAMLPVTVLLACLTLAASCLAGWAAAALSGRLARYKAALSLLYAALLLGLAVGLNLLMQRGLTWLLTHMEEAAAGLRADAGALWLLGCAAAGQPAALAALAAVSLGALALAWLWLRRSYPRLLAARPAAPKAAWDAAKRPPRRRSLRRALLGRELRRLAGCTSYMVNGMLGSLCLAAAAPALVWQAGAARGLLARLPAGTAPALGAAALCSLVSMALLTPPSVSLEGRTLWLLQSLPVTPWQALRAKLDLHMVLVGPPALAGALAWLWVLAPRPADAALTLLAVGLYALLCGAAGLVLGVCLANLHWTNEAAAVKQGAAPVAALFVNWAALAVLCGLWLAARRPLGGTGALALCCAAMAAGCAGALGWLRRCGAKRFAQL